jgi:hypothetical protein
LAFVLSICPKAYDTKKKKNMLRICFNYNAVEPQK